MTKKPEVFEEVSSAQKAAMDALTESAAASGKGFEKLQAEFVAYVKSSGEAFTEATKAIFGAKSIEAAMEAQQAYVKSAFEMHMTEMTKLTRLFTDSMKTAIEPFSAQTKGFAQMFQVKVA